MKDVMIDLETCGTAPGSVILSIGAVGFDPESGKLGPEFYNVISAGTSIASGLSLDYKTMLWWSGQSAEAREVLKAAASPGLYGQAYDIWVVLTNFTTYLSQFGKDVRVWGNGAAFDNVLLQEAYRRAGRAPAGWSFHNDRCYRTLKSLFPYIKLTRVGTHHNALDDAKSQALHAVALLQHLDKLQHTRETGYAAVVQLERTVAGCNEAHEPNEATVAALEAAERGDTQPIGDLLNKDVP